jgi:glutaminyl-peptide cyclotransferase
MRYFFLFFISIFATGCGTAANTANNTNVVKATPKPATPITYTFDIVKSYPHDPKAFTQGLVFHNGFLYEGTGGKDGDSFYSSVRKVDFETGKVLQKHDLSRDFFGEGITIHNDKVYQLTWRERTAFVYDLADFKPAGEFRYSGEGWGLTDDGTSFYMSDGTHVIRVVDPENFQTKRTIVVNDENGKPVLQLNELEWVKGEIWANVWRTGWIMRIDPSNGKVLGRIDLNRLADDEFEANPNADVLNGIAYDEVGDRILVTGKMWRKVFEIKLKQQ